MINPQTADALHSSGRKFTPVSIELLSGSTVITGANMGGKSVAVKTLALNVLLALCGFPVFAGKPNCRILPAYTCSVRIWRTAWADFRASAGR